MPSLLTKYKIQLPLPSVGQSTSLIIQTGNNGIHSSTSDEGDKMAEARGSGARWSHQRPRLDCLKKSLKHRILVLLHLLRSEWLEPASFFQRIHIWMAMPGDALLPSCPGHSGDISTQRSLSGMARNPCIPRNSKASDRPAFYGLISRVDESNTMFFASGTKSLPHLTSVLRF